MTVALACLLISCLLVLVLSVLLVRMLLVRHRLVRGSDVYPCTVRVLRGAVPRLTDHIRGCGCRAQWTHDVLLLHRGFFLAWTQPLAVRIAEGLIEPAGLAQEHRLGAGAVQLRLRLDDDSVIAVAAPAWAREQLAGPFLAIAVHGLPPGISKRRP